MWYRSALSSKLTSKHLWEALREGAPQLLAPVLRKRQTLIEDARDAGHSIFSYVPTGSYRKKAQRESQQDYLALADFVIRPYCRGGVMSKHTKEGLSILGRRLHRSRRWRPARCLT